MSLFWPSKLSRDAKAVVYLGRAFHWLGCAIALAACLFGIYYIGHGIVLMLGGRPTGATLTMGFGIVLVGAGIVTFFCGRTLRYVFSRE